MSENLNSNNIEDDEYNLNKINKKEIEEKISKTRGCLLNEISFLLGLVFIKNKRFI